MKMNDVVKSALWALAIYPIVAIGSLFTWTIVALLDSFKGLPVWLRPVIVYAAPFLGFFLFIFISIKIYKVLKKTREANMAKEQLEKDKNV